MSQAHPVRGGSLAIVIERLRELPSYLRYLVYVAGALLALFVVFGVGVAAAVVVGVQPERVASGSGGPAESGPAESRTLEDTAIETTNGAKALEDTAIETTNGAKNANPKELANVASFAHTATDENSRGDYTYLSDPSINGDPNAIVLVERAPDRGSADEGAYDHNIGVWYDFRVDQEKWAIFNQDRAVVPTGAAFRVVIPPASESFVHRARRANTVGNITYVDDPLTNGEPDVVLAVTQNWNPGGGVGVYNDHPVGVLYDEDVERWAVYNRDDAPMPYGSAFNVAVSGGGDGAR
jgi:hypothetical protein